MIRRFAVILGERKKERERGREGEGERDADSDLRHPEILTPPDIPD